MVKPAFISSQITAAVIIKQNTSHEKEVAGKQLKLVDEKRKIFFSLEQKTKKHLNIYVPLYTVML